MRMNVLDWIAWVLVIIGGINWGLVGLLDFNLVGVLLGDGTLVARIVYILVGLSALYLLFSLPSKRAVATDSTVD